VPIIFLTASKQPGLREKALASGAADFFEKPYEAEEFLAAIHMVLDAPVESLPLNVPYFSKKFTT
jgi:CheY-like chemotaxis protein